MTTTRRDFLRGLLATSALVALPSSPAPNLGSASLALDGTGDFVGYVDEFRVSKYSGGGDWTIDFWFRPDGAAEERITGWRHVSRSVTTEGVATRLDGREVEPRSPMADVVSRIIRRMAGPRWTAHLAPPTEDWTTIEAERASDAPEDGR